MKFTCPWLPAELSAVVARGQPEQHRPRSALGERVTFPALTLTPGWSFPVRWSSCLVHLQPPPPPLPHTHTHTHTWVPLSRKTEASEGKLCSFPQNLPLPVCHQHGDSVNAARSVCRSHTRTPCLHRCPRVCCVVFIWGSREDLGKCLGRERGLHNHCCDAEHGPPGAGVKGTSHFLHTLSSRPPSPSPGTSSVDRCSFVLLFGYNEWAGQVLEQISQTSLWPPSKRGCTEQAREHCWDCVHAETHETGIRGAQKLEPEPCCVLLGQKK